MIRLGPYLGGGGFNDHTEPILEGGGGGFNNQTFHYKLVFFLCD